jgi:hypothetical protein
VVPSFLFADTPFIGVIIKQEAPLKNLKHKPSMNRGESKWY